MADPERIGRYVIEAVLGRGAMGVIYRAHDPEIDRRVAIKLIRADLLAGEDRAEFVARFRREAQAAGRCSHPNIVAVYDFALHEGNPFLAMEFVDGVTLSQVIAEARGGGGGIALETAVGFVQQVLAALDAAHRLGIVHRDVKPANVMLAGDGCVKVADFGISRIGSSSLTQDGAMVGTPSYMSPEQCRGEVVDARSDLFSVGVVMFELLSGEKPFKGANAVEVLGKLLHQEAPDLGLAAPFVPAEVRAVVRRSLAKDKAGRFGSAAAMGAALTAAMAAGSDSTVIVGSPGAPGAAAVGFEPAMIERLERRLALYVGPIARHLMRTASRSSDGVEQLCATLAASIEGPVERTRFAREALADAAGGATMTGAFGAIPEAEVEALQLALARHVGPVARLLVKRIRPGAGSVADLWRAAAVHIEDERARAAFLRSGPG